MATPLQSKPSNDSTETSKTAMSSDDREPINNESHELANPKHATSRPMTSTNDPAAVAQKRPAAVETKYQKTDWMKFIKKKRYWPWWALLIVLVVLAILMTLYHRQIVDWLRPVSNRIRSLSWGWIIPILILIALSFPPLFGHEIIIVLCGVVYGLWIGFGIVAAGTFIGEIGTYIAFRTFLYKRALKMEAKNLDYGALARMTREGGFLIVFIVRLSVIPSHFTTAVFATCGLNFWLFVIASFVTLPKQLVIVYLGVIIGNQNKGKTVQDIVLGITALITILCGVYIWWRLRKVRREMIQEAEQELEAEGVVNASNNERDEEMEATAAEHETRIEQEEEMRERELRNERERQKQAEYV